LIPRDTVDKIIEAARVEEVIGEFITLKKRGVNLLGLCPFHGEKTPSFTVSPVKGIYKCFGCGKAGSTVNFVMEHLGLTYPEALKWLAGKYAIEVVEKEITSEEKQKLSERESMLIVMQFAARYFFETMHQTDEGQSIGLGYFTERGLHPEIISRFQLGYSPEERNAFAEAAVKAGYLPEYLVKTGMCIVSNRYQEGNPLTTNDIFDRYAGRVMFPIHDSGGRVVAFGGRTLSSDKKIAKYINSPETDIYNKSKILYGLWQGKKSIQQNNLCYLVEGYMDVIAMHQAGIENVVASSGTSLTIEQAKAIHRFANQVVILYDGDDAGQKASNRAIPILLEEGLNVKVLLFPDNHDPDSYSRLVGNEPFAAYLEAQASDFLLFKAKKLSEEGKRDPLKKAELIKELVQNIALIPEAITRSVYVKECGRIMDISEQILQTEVNKLRRKSGVKGKVNEALDQQKEKTEVTEALIEPENETQEEIWFEEEELLKIMMSFGNVVVEAVTEPDQNIETSMELTISEYVIFEMWRDELEFKNPLHQMILEEFMAEIGKGEIPLMKHFINHPNPVISGFALNNARLNYELSKHWEKFGIHMEDERLGIKKVVNHLFFGLKEKYLNLTLTDFRESLKTVSEEDSTDIQRKIVDLEKAKVRLNKILGRVVIK